MTTWEAHETGRGLSIQRYNEPHCSCCRRTHPRAASLGGVTERQGLRQQKRILSRFRRPEVQNHGVSRAVLSRKALEPSWPLPAPGGPWHSLACGHIPTISAPVFTWLPCVSPLLCLMRTLVVRFRARQPIQGDRLRSVITVAKALSVYIKG